MCAEPAALHRPVLLAECVALLGVRPGGVYVDATVGEGGHTSAILAASAPDGRVIGLDRDPTAIASVRASLAPFGDRFEARHGRFGDLLALVPEPVDGVLMDLGVRSPQLDQAERGFSFLRDGPVDMRMNPDEGLSAAELLDTLDLDGLTAILRDLGEEPRARQIARAILAGRPWTSTLALADTVARASGYHGGRTHPATRTFQALRMAVNDELGELERGVEAAFARVRPGGRIVIISFHSLEDRYVKRRFREAAGVGTPRDGYGHPVTPPTARLLEPGGLDGKTLDSENPRARSARARAVEVLPPTRGSDASGARNGRSAG